MSGPDLPPPSGPPVVPAQPSGAPPQGPAHPASHPSPQGTPYPPPQGHPHPSPQGPEAPHGVSEDALDGQWQRLSRRMLLVHPVRTLWSMAFPILIAIFGLSRGSSQQPWWVWVALVGGGIALIAGVFTWFITRYRFTDEQLQLRTGLLSRRVLTAPLDRIRSVDIESAPIQRALGLAKVQVGTGVDASRIELDGLTKEQAASLRTYLLARSEVTGPTGTTAPQVADAAQPGGSGDDPGEGTAYPQEHGPGVTQPETELARIDWSWLRYAPFSLSSLVVVAGVVGVLSQFGEDLPIDQLEVAQDAWAWIMARALMVIIASAALIIAVGWVVVSTISYVFTWWNLRLVSEASGNLRLTRGLLTTHSQTIERSKVRGVRMGEPFLLRFVKGAELSVLATGVGLGGTTKVLPPSPRSVVTEVGHVVLEEDGPLTMDLIGHGPRARTRIHLQQQWGTLIPAGLLAIPTYLFPWEWAEMFAWWGPLAVLGGLGLVNVLLADSAWRNLGHGLTDEHLVVQTGAVIRTREVLERAGIIGWVVRQSFFQRRRGLADLHATTAAGAEVVVAPNMPVHRAVQLAHEATPGMLDDFVA